MISMTLYYTVGEFKGKAATQYCMNVSDTQIWGSIFQDSEEYKKWELFMYESCAPIMAYH